MRKPKIYGYVRISTSKQSVERQIRNIKAVYPDAIIIVEVYTGTKFDGRKEFDRLMRIIKAGDTIVFDSVSRMSRSADEGFDLYEELFNLGINLVFLKEPHINTESYKQALEGIINVGISSGDSATDDLINSIMKAVNLFMMNKVKADIKKAFEQAEKEVKDLRERTKEGLETARIEGKQIGQKPGAKLTTKKSVEAKKQIQKYNKDFGGSLNNEDTIKLIGISHNSFYKYKKELLEAAV